MCCCREGNIFPGTTPGPVVFILKCLPHSRFKRSGADLIYTATIPLYHALAGTAIKVKMLDEKTFDAPLSEIVTPGHRSTIPGMGLPDLRAGPSARGNLIIETQLLFPKHLSQAQKKLLKAAMFLPSEKDDCDAVKAFVRAFEDPQDGWYTGIAD